MSGQNSSVLFSRLLSLKESTPFLLVLDSLGQTSQFLIKEFIHRIADGTKIVYLSFETLNRPVYSSEFLDCSEVTLTQIVDFVHGHAQSDKRILVIIDSLNYIANDQISGFLTKLINPYITLLGVYHTDVLEAESKIANYPSTLSLLSYIAGCIFELHPILKKIDTEYLESQMERLEFPINCDVNHHTYRIVLTTRRKSGRSLIYNFVMNSVTHEFEIYKLTKEEQQESTDELLKDLTTFNLNTSTKQKLAKEQVELPYLEAQEFGSGGAIVYEFEKDDDYDEEDPYEDPF